MVRFSVHFWPAHFGAVLLRNTSPRVFPMGSEDFFSASSRQGRRIFGARCFSMSRVRLNESTRLPHRPCLEQAVGEGGDRLPPKNIKKQNKGAGQWLPQHGPYSFLRPQAKRLEVRNNRGANVFGWREVSAPNWPASIGRLRW